MYPCNRQSERPRRRGFTLVEMLLAVAILTFMAGALAMLTHAVRISSEHADGTSTAAQHARVIIERINTILREAQANESFPGAVVFRDTIGAYSYPDTLVIWAPSGAPVDPVGMPRFNELVVFCPHPTQPNNLLEIRNPSDTRAVPPISSLSTWASELTLMKTANGSDKVSLTDLLRTARPTSGSNDRGVVHFVVALRPSAADLASFRAGTTAFDAVPWAQSVYGAKTGLRQTWLQTELHLVPGYNRNGDPSRAMAAPFFGSAELYWTFKQ